ncbi:MAG: glycosyltransferase family 2 protein [Magnetococcales bacterium]|nr:glycosyltransferase family 2 protein [Magnetococcales bacterium]
MDTTGEVAKPVSTLEGSGLVSVIMATRNRASLLRRSIGSVLAQSMTNWELIVVDDHSTDDTPVQLQAFQDPRIRTIRNATRCGAAASANNGLRLARGEYVTFLDDDDVWHTDFLTVMNSEAASMDPAPTFLFSITERRYHDGRRVQLPASGQFPRGELLLSDTLLWRNVTGKIAWFIRRDFLSTLGGFDERLPASEDWELLLRASAQTCFHFVDRCLAIACESHENLTRNPRLNLEARRHILEQHRTRISVNPYLHAHHLREIGHLAMRLGTHREGRRYLFHSLIVAPWSMKSWILALCSLMGGRIYRMLSRLSSRAREPFSSETPPRGERKGQCEQLPDCKEGKPQGEDPLPALRHRLDLSPYP